MSQLTQTDAQKIADILVPFIGKVAREWDCKQVDYLEEGVELRSETKRIVIKIIVTDEK